MNTPERKVAIICMDEPVFYGRLYAQIIDAAPQTIHSVLVLPGILGRDLKTAVRQIFHHLMFYGFAGFCYAAWRVVRARATGSGDFVRAARRHGIPTTHCASLAEAIEYLRAHRVDIVAASVPMRVPSHGLASAGIGWINIHCGPLPRYAGSNGPFWCMLYNEPALTVTMHYMDERFDTGPIIAQASIPNDGRPYFPLVDALFDRAFEIFLDFLRTLKPSPGEAQRQDPSKRTYLGIPSVKDGKQFRREGKRFI